MPATLAIEPSLFLCVAPNSTVQIVALQVLKDVAIRGRNMRSDLIDGLRPTSPEFRQISESLLARGCPGQLDLNSIHRRRQTCLDRGKRHHPFAEVTSRSGTTSLPHYTIQWDAS